MEYNIGIDLGGTTIKLGIVNADGKIIDSLIYPTLAESNSIDTIYKNMVNAISDLKDRNKKIKISGIGIGSPGVITPDEEKIIGISNIPVLNGFPLAKEFSKEFGVPAYIDNDANSAARGEYLFGAAKGKDNFFMVTLGTGVGGAIFIDGKLYKGYSNFAGEMGHMIIVTDGKFCTCGNFGCWEAYASASAMVKKARTLVERGYETSLSLYYPELNAKIIVEEARKGDEIAVDVVVEIGKYVGIGISNIINILNPHYVVIGGGLSHAGDILLNEIKHYSKVNTRPFSWEIVDIVMAELGNQAGIMGSAALAFMENQENKSKQKDSHEKK